MSRKLERIETDLKKARIKRTEWDKRVKELEQRYTEEENTEIHGIVHEFNVTPEQLHALLLEMKERMPGVHSTADKQEVEKENEE